MVEVVPPKKAVKPDKEKAPDVKQIWQAQNGQKQSEKTYDYDLWLLQILFAQRQQAISENNNAEKEDAEKNLANLYGIDKPEESLSQILGDMNKGQNPLTNLPKFDASPAMSERRSGVLQSKLLDMIAKHESGGDYNIVYGAKSKRDFNGDGRQEQAYIEGQGVMFHGQRRLLTSMTIKEVREWQDDYVNKHGEASSAAGKYQIIRKTLDAICQQMNLSGNEKFDESMQDRMAKHLMDQRGYQKYLRGEISDSAFAKSLAKEWASLPDPTTGRSVYAGDGLNSSHHAVSDVMNVIAQDKREKTGLGNATARNDFASATGKNEDAFAATAGASAPSKPGSPTRTA